MSLLSDFFKFEYVTGGDFMENEYEKKKKPSTDWYTLAKLVEGDGCEVNWAERYFVCPFCERRVYDAHWDNEDYTVDEDLSMYGCPYCGGIITFD